VIVKPGAVLRTAKILNSIFFGKFPIFIYIYKDYSLEMLAKNFFLKLSEIIID
jgi:hypothetical protein